MARNTGASIARLAVQTPALDRALAATPRRRESFDRDWRFHPGAAAGAWQTDFDDTAWRRLDLPHDWSIEDLPPREAPARPALAIGTGSWLFRPGDDPAWKEPGLDDSAWQNVQLPAAWEKHSNYTQDNVYGWYRRRLAIPAELRGRDLLLAVGKLDDVDETFVNGVKVGGLGSFPPSFVSAWDQPRVYPVAASLLKGDGTDVVAIRCFDGQGAGGLYAALPPAARNGPFDSQAEGGGAQGFTTGGVAWYRKTFRLPEAQRGRRVTLTFDGVYMGAEVWCNGQRLGEHPYGYSTFRFDLTPCLQFGDRPNLVAVKVDSSGRTSRWYSGSGIYRHVWLTFTGAVCLDHDQGVFVSTPRVTAEAALVKVSSLVRCEPATADLAATLGSRVVAASGKTLATASTAIAIPAGGRTGAVTQELSVSEPDLWSPDSPTLYRLVTTVEVGGRTVDQAETWFGIRTVEIDAQNGFRLNGQPLKLRGGCVHHDNGYLGACTYDRAEERRVELLRASGYNAIRTSHNPPSPAFLDACDRLGMLVMDEAFDCWRQGKNPQDYGRFFDAWWQRDLEAMVWRDRNHPCVVMWSLGNEIPEQGTPAGAEIAARMAAYVRGLDPTRPLAQAAHPGTNPWENLDPLFDHLEVCGYNYKVDRYRPDHERLPRRVIAGTESMPAHAFEHWMATLDLPYVIGDYVWTALDYLGEAALGFTYFEGEPSLYATWPWTVANCGDLDLCGFKRPQSFYRDVLWQCGAPVCCFVQEPLPPGKGRELIWGWGWPDEKPSWTWPGREGQPLTVRVYAACPQVRLLLNGRDLGLKETTRATRFTATYEVPYEPGQLVAVGLGSTGAEVGRWDLRTAGAPTQIRLSPDRRTLKADGQDLCYVTVELLDANGVVNPNAESLIRFDIAGPGTIAGVGNGDPRSTESLQQPQRQAYRGRCLAIVKASTQPGKVRLSARLDGLPEASVTLTLKRGG